MGFTRLAVQDRAMTGSVPRLLVLEDDDGVRTSVTMVMESEGYEVHGAADAETALELASRHEVDVMMVDLMLGGMDGFTFIKRVRLQSGAPIVVVSARSGTQDIVAALEVGADDYVTKPFVVEELQARIRALLRRPLIHDPATAADDELIVLDTENSLVLDASGGVVRRGEHEIHLTTTEFRLLAALADHAGRVLSRLALLELVWSRGHHGDERIVDVHIRRLRTKIEVDAAAPRTVTTVRGLGYRLDLH
jgi:DNA-binding response OmpR family regulator